MDPICLSLKRFAFLGAMVHSHLEMNEQEGLKDHSTGLSRSPIDEEGEREKKV